MNRKIVITGVSLILISIILGAFGAHGLKPLITPAKLVSFETGVRYQMYHGLAFLFIGLNSDRFTFSLQLFFRFVLSGTILFCFSIYFLAIEQLLGSKLSFLGPVTPIGGVFIITGWILMLIGLLKSFRSN